MTKLNVLNQTPQNSLNVKTSPIYKYKSIMVKSSLYEYN